MKKVLLILIALLCVPVITMADSAVVYTDLSETLSLENIKISSDSYVETDDQATIYLFYGDGCPHCAEFLEFLNSNIEEYGKYFKLRAYEVWGNDQNAQFMEDVGKSLNVEVTGVPFIVIGDKHFSGFSEDSADDVIEAILDEYEKEEKTVILENNNTNNENNFFVIGFTSILVIIIVAIIFAKKTNQKTN